MAVEKDTEKTVVIFRYYDHGEFKGDVDALFPYWFENAEESYNCMSYAHIGQHGGADYQGVMSRTRPATAEEYADLKRELESLGYNLDVRQRRVHKTWRKEYDAERARLKALRV